MVVRPGCVISGAEHLFEASPELGQTHSTSVTAKDSPAYRPAAHVHPDAGVAAQRQNVLVTSQTHHRMGEATRTWFAQAFATPTPVQEQAWESIATGADTLVISPTGSGKTLAAFLWALDRLVAEPGHGCRVLYISPLRALAADVERNLRAPLAGIERVARDLGQQTETVRTAIRTADTPAAERQRMARTPPDILITTPESLFLLLTSRAGAFLADVETVILDEIHSVAGTKRGSHLSLSLARLDLLTERPAQRIGLSATVTPVDAVAEYLHSGHDVRIVAPETTKPTELHLSVPLADMTTFDEPEDGGPRRASIWPAVESSVLELIEDHTSTIVFTNSRRVCERLSSRLNELAADEPDDTTIPAQMMAMAGTARGSEHIVARAHHGSVSKSERALIEDALKSGQLPAVVATSSLELGIDMGSIDLMVQVGCPPSAASGLQRLGRAGHRLDAVSKGGVLPDPPRGPAGDGRRRAPDACGTDRGHPGSATPPRRAQPADRGDGRHGGLARR